MSLNRSALGGAKDPAVGGRLTTNTRILSSGSIGWYQRLIVRDLEDILA